MRLWIQVLMGIVLLSFGIAGFRFLETMKAVLWLIFCIAAYPIALAFTVAEPLQGQDLLELYKTGVSQVPVIGKLFTAKK